MPGSSIQLNGVTVYLVPADGPHIRTARDATDLMSDASEHHASLIAIPVERLGDEFFELRTGIAGEVLQKFVTYGRRIAIIGDISERIAASKSLAALVIESNRNRDLWFVSTLDDLAARLAETRDAN